MARLKQQLTYLLAWGLNSASLAACLLLDIPVKDPVPFCIGWGAALAGLEQYLLHKLRDE